MMVVVVVVRWVTLLVMVMVMMIWQMPVGVAKVIMIGMVIKVMVVVIMGMMMMMMMMTMMMMMMMILCGQSRTHSNTILGEGWGADSVVLGQATASIASRKEGQEILVGIGEDVHLAAQGVIGDGIRSPGLRVHA